MAKKIKAFCPHIIVNTSDVKPCYSIVYYDVADKHWHIGFSSFKLSFVRKWLKEEFEEVDVEFVEVKHGEWMPYESEEPYGDESETTWYKCSICGTDAIGRCYDDEWYSYPIRTDYCPKCGAGLRTPKERGGEK